MSHTSDSSIDDHDDLPNSDKSPPTLDRRSFLNTASTMLMAGGVGVSYGSLALMAGLYLYPTSDGKAWLFVSRADRIAPGSSFEFESPTGVNIAIKREEIKLPADQIDAKHFLALSSICPHLGCRVHWEGHNDRYFCPCHNGVFDPVGKATGGPPAAAGQDLPSYPLMIEEGNLYIEMPIVTV